MDIDAKNEQLRWTDGFGDGNMGFVTQRGQTSFLTLAGYDHRAPRMSQEEVRELLPYLQSFAETGHLTGNNGPQTQLVHRFYVAYDAAVPGGEVVTGSGVITTTVPEDDDEFIPAVHDALAAKAKQLGLDVPLEVRVTFFKHLNSYHAQVPQA